MMEVIMEHRRHIKDVLILALDTVEAGSEISTELSRLHQQLVDYDDKELPDDWAFRWAVQDALQRANCMYLIFRVPLLRWKL